jgi:hypothetical protein
MITSRRIRAQFIPLVAIFLLAAKCADAPTAPDPAPALDALFARGGGGGKPAPDYVTHPLHVTFADRAGDSYTSDGGGSYTHGVDGKWMITDYADPSRPDHFQFLPEPGGDRLTRLSVPGAVPPTDCGYFRFSVRDTDTPDLYATADGWTGSGSATLLCGQGREGYTLEIGECVAMTHGSAGHWTATANDCDAEVWRGKVKLGVFPVSFAFDAVEL